MLCIHYFLIKRKKLIGRPNTKMYSSGYNIHRMKEISVETSLPFLQFQTPTISRFTYL